MPSPSHIVRLRTIPVPRWPGTRPSSLEWRSANHSTCRRVTTSVLVPNVRDQTTWRREKTTGPDHGGCDDRTVRPSPSPLALTTWAWPAGKYVPFRLADRGVRHCTGLWALGFDREMTPGTPGTNFLEGLPDMDAMFDLGDIRDWLGGRHRARRRRPGTAGIPVTVSPRGALRRAIAQWHEVGYAPRSAWSSRPTSWSPTVMEAGGRSTRREPSSTAPGRRSTPTG